MGKKQECGMGGGSNDCAVRAAIQRENAMIRESTTFESAEPSARLMRIPPATAQAWLARSAGNRAIRATHVEYLANAIEAGDWLINGDAIRFDGNGSLIDGHHRLHAVVKSGQAIQSIVVTGLCPEARFAIDINNAARTLQDVVKMDPNDRMGGRYHTRRVSVARSIRSMISNHNNKVKFSHSDLKRFEEYFSDALDFAVPLFSTAFSSLGRAPVAGAVVFAHATAPKLVETFARRFVSGEELSRGDAELTLRNWLLSSQRPNGVDVSVRSLSAIYAAHRGAPLHYLKTNAAAMLHFRRVHEEAIREGVI